MQIQGESIRKLSSPTISKKRLGFKPEIISLPLSALRANSKNPRIHSERQIKQLAKSISTFGFISPVLVDEVKTVVAGHGRLQAAKLLGLREVPTINIGHLSEAQLRAFMIADNRLAEHATWDSALLGEHFRALSEVELDFEIEATGFEVGEIDMLIEGLSVSGEGPDPADTIPEHSGVAVTKPGDLWHLGSHRVLCGNAVSPDHYAELMNGKSAAMVFSDPPYNVKIEQVTGLGAIRHKSFQMASGEMSESEFTDFLMNAFQLAISGSISGALHFWFMDWKHAGEILEAGGSAYTELKNIVVWVKSNAGMGSLYRSQHEFIFVFKAGKENHRNNIQLGTFGRHRTNVWNYSGANSFSRTTEEGNLLELHPTVKPAAMIADGILDCTKRRDIVLDPFLGSGTTVIAAERVGRVCYGLELDPLYVDTIIRRWQKFTGLTAIHSASGCSFPKLEMEVSGGSN